MAFFTPTHALGVVLTTKLLHNDCANSTSTIIVELVLHNIFHRNKSHIIIIKLATEIR